MTMTGQNAEVYQGDYRVLEVTVLDENDQPLDINGCDLTWVVYKLSTSVISLTKTIGSGIELTVPSGGIFEITIEPADTVNLLGNYNHECELTDSSSHPFTILTGYFKVIRSIANKP